MEFPEYQGISYSAASREGCRLLEEARTTGYWFHLPERLHCLRGIMERLKALGQTA